MKKKPEKLRDQLSYFLRGIRAQNLKNRIFFTFRDGAYYYYIEFDNEQKIELRIALADFQQTEFNVLVATYQKVIFNALRSGRNNMLQSKFVPAPIGLLHENKEMLLGFGAWCARNITYIGNHGFNFEYALFGPDIPRNENQPEITMDMAFSYYLRYLEKDKVRSPEFGIVDLSIITPNEFPDSEPEKDDPGTMDEIENILKNDL